MTNQAPIPPQSPEPPPYVDRTIFLTKAKLQVHIVTAPDDLWACDVTHTPVDEANLGDETRRDQAELWAVYEELGLKEPRGLKGAAADMLTRPLDRILIRRKRTERMRYLSAPPLDTPPAAG